MLYNSRTVSFFKRVRQMLPGPSDKMMCMARRGAAMLLAAVLAAGTLPVPVLAEQQVTPTPTPDPHGPWYYEPAQTDSLPGWPAGPGIESQCAVMIDLSNGGILYSKNADMVMYPASITKILTCLLAVENLDPAMSFVMTESAAFGIESGSSSIYADTDEVFTVEQAIMALMLESANEMALMLGELVSGSEKKFVEMMNERVVKFGCTHTHFNNPNGLPDENHYTTASDMAKIAFECWKDPRFRHYVTTSYYDIPPTNKQSETRYMSNHHKMMEGKDYAYDGVLGGKTGYTEAAGNTLVTYAQRGDLSLAVVILNSPGTTYGDTAALLDYGFASFGRKDMTGVMRRETPEEAVTSEFRALAGYRAPFPAAQRTSGFTITVPEGVSADRIDVIRIPHKNAPGRPFNEYVYYYEGNRAGSGWEYL